MVPGDYTVVQTQPDNFTDVSEDEGGADDDKPDNGVPNSIAATVDAGENDVENDFVDELAKGSLSGKVQEVLANGSLVPMENVSLTLLDSVGNIVTTVLTDSHGEYTFPDLTPGEYTVVETQPDGYYSIWEEEGGLDDDKPDDGVINSIAAVVSPGETDVDNDFAEGELGSLSGKVLQELNGGGLEGLENVYLVLKDLNGNVIASTYTDEHGEYIFEGLIPGEYTVEETQPPGYANVSENEGGKDNDVSNSTLNVISASVGVGENDSDNDFIESKNLVTPTPTPTPTPQIADLTSDSATIHWENVSGEFGYRIYRDGKLVAIVGADQTSYELTNLTSGEEYKYVIVPFNGQGNMISESIEFKVEDGMFGWLPAIYHILF